MVGYRSDKAHAAAFSSESRTRENVKTGIRNVGEAAKARPVARAFALVFLCFLYSSTGYLSWLYRLADFVQPSHVDLITMVGGYLCQALGIAGFGIAAQRGFAAKRKLVPAAAIAASFICLLPALLGTNFAEVLAFGFLANLLIGFLAGYYLYALARDVPARLRATVFGGAYGAATIAAWLLSLPGSGNFLHSPQALLVYAGFAVLAAATILVVERPENAPDAVREQPPESEGDAPPRASGQVTPISSGATAGKPAPASDFRRFFALACATVALLSLVKNLGFSFPMADIQSGLDLELSRVAYAVGLVIAGIVSDRNRKYGALLCLISLVSPFIMLALAGEPISSMVFWCLDYFFFGFFAVFRAVLFADIADENGVYFLAGAGLLCGRVGDALGTALLMVLAGRTFALVIVAGVLFAIAVALFVLLFQRLFMPQPQPATSERELFERFSARYSLTAREREVLRLIVEEKTNSEIAAALFVSENTVKFHVRNLLKKTGCKNRLEMIAKYADIR